MKGGFLGILFVQDAGTALQDILDIRMAKPIVEDASVRVLKEKKEREDKLSDAYDFLPITEYIMEIGKYHKLNTNIFESIITVKKRQKSLDRKRVAYHRRAFLAPSASENASRTIGGRFRYRVPSKE